MRAQIDGLIYNKTHFRATYELSSPKYAVIKIAFRTIFGRNSLKNKRKRN